MWPHYHLRDVLIESRAISDISKIYYDILISHLTSLIVQTSRLVLYCTNGFKRTYHLFYRINQARYG